MTLPIAIGLRRREEGLSPSFFKAMSRPPRNQGRTASGIPPWKASRMSAMSARAPLPGTKAALTSKVSMARECRIEVVESWTVYILLSSHYDAVTHVIYRDTIRAGIEGRTEVRGLFSSLLPHANARRHREERDGLVPDALLRRPTELDAMYKDHLHDVKIIHMGSSTYSDTMVKERKVSPGVQTRGTPCTRTTCTT